MTNANVADLPRPVIQSFKVNSKVWSSDSRRRLSGLVANGSTADRLMAMATGYLQLYLMTSPVANKLGMYYLPLDLIHNDTGISRAEIVMGIRYLERDDFLAYDMATQCVWIKEMAMWQLGSALYPVRADDVRTKQAVRKIYAGMPFCAHLGAFHEKYASTLLLPPLDESAFPKIGSPAPSTKRASRGGGAGSDAVITTPSGKSWGTQDDLDFAHYAFEKIRIVVPTAALPNWVDWANETRLMRMIDGMTIERIRAIFDWANRDTFWCRNILSIAKLRKQKDQLSAQMATGTNAADPLANMKNVL